MRFCPIAVLGALVVLPAGAGAAPSKTDLVPVWALMQGDAPVAGAKVTVRTPDGRAVALKHAKTTNENGVAIVRLAARAPRDFTVVVTGGSVDGVPIKGTLR